MNGIEKLIAELCPEGVDWKTLGEVISLEYGKPLKGNNRNGGEFPVLGSNGRVGFHDSFLVNGPCLIIGRKGSAGALVWEEKNCYPIDTTFFVKINYDRLDLKYLFYKLSTLQLTDKKQDGGVPGINRNNVYKFLIPIPPLTIQQEIVKILDTFTALEAELEAELEARKKQYEYYRDELLTFGEDVEWKTLNEIGKVSMCKRIFKNETLTSGDIPFYKIGTFGKQPNAFIPREIFDEYRKKFSFPKKGDVLLSASGTIGRRVIYNGEPAYFQDSNIIWIDNDESKVLNKFLYYLYAIIEWKTEGGTIQRLYNDNLKKIKVPIPPLAEQERIVAILDKFDALVNDISIGLPAEINARRKQYEYYRDKLLTFQAKS